MEILDDRVRAWLDSAQFVKPGSGVYVLYNRNKDIIFIGESENLQQTFTKYVNTNFEENSCKQKTVSYQREYVDNPTEKAKQLLDDFKNENNKLPACNIVN